MRIFISYKRNINPDEKIATQIYEALRTQHSVFIDQTMHIGMKWAERIQREIEQCDFFITFLSASAVGSEMVVGEIETAYNLNKRTGKPYILPVRLNFTTPFEYPLSAYLNQFNWADWRSDNDTAKLVAQLLTAISQESFETQPAPLSSVKNSVPSIPGDNPAPHAQIDQPEGTMPPDSKFYIKRTSDEIALNALENHAPIITIKGSRQVGKSSLLMRITAKAVELNQNVIFIDFQLFDEASRKNAEVFFKQFTRTIVRKLKLPNHINDHWDSGSSQSLLCTEYMEDYVIPELDRPLMIAMDEVESIFDTDFRTDFFSMLRSWHNARSHPNQREWENITLSLVTSTEPYQFIKDLNQSPFNVGKVIDLEDFTFEQTKQLNALHDLPMTNSEVADIFDLLNGHPYLTRRAFYLVASKQLATAEVMRTAALWNGCFGDHLRYHLFRLQKKSEFIDVMLEILETSKSVDDQILHRLLGAGLLRREENRILPRCNLYGLFFKEHLRA